MELEDEVALHLKNNNIAYKKNIKFYKANIQVLEIDFIIPGAIIEVKSSVNTKTKELVAQLKRQLHYIPADFLIYLYIETLHANTNVNEITFDSRIKILRDLNDIKPMHIDYCILEPAVIGSIASTLNVDYDYQINKYKNFTIFTPNYIYNRAMVTMNDIELNRLKSFNIKISEELPDRVIIIYKNKHMQTQNLPVNFKYLDQTFNVFLDICKFYKLESYRPNKYVEGITFTCKSCKEIWFLTLMKDNKCFKCIKNVNYVPIGTKRKLDNVEYKSIQKIELRIGKKRRLE